MGNVLRVKNLLFLQNVVVVLVIIWIVINGMLLRNFGDVGIFRTNSPEIHIATVVCSTRNNEEPRNEAAVMMKSVIISALIYGIPKITFHILQEHENDTNFYRDKLNEMGYLFRNVETNLKLYEICKVLPKNLQKFVFNIGFRCTHGRAFLPRILKDLDAVLYFDTDFIVLGNVTRFWNLFTEMTDEQFLGVTVNREAGCKGTSPSVQGLPYPKPKGLSAGMLVMNLTRMRRSNWEERYLRLHTDYSKLLRNPLNDQQVLNILSYHNPGVIRMVPCHYNFWHIYCTNNGMCCPAAQNDFEGVIAIAGGAQSFGVGRYFREFFVAYKQINISDPNVDLKRDLMQPLRLVYSNMTLGTNVSLTNKGKRIGMKSKCDGELYKYLFKKSF